MQHDGEQAVRRESACSPGGHQHPHQHPHQHQHQHGTAATTAAPTEHRARVSLMLPAALVQPPPRDWWLALPPGSEYELYRLALVHRGRGLPFGVGAAAVGQSSTRARTHTSISTSIKPAQAAPSVAFAAVASAARLGQAHPAQPGVGTTAAGRFGQGHSTIRLYIHRAQPKISNPLGPCSTLLDVPADTPLPALLAMASTRLQVQVTALRNEAEGFNPAGYSHGHPPLELKDGAMLVAHEAGHRDSEAEGGQRSARGDAEPAGKAACVDITTTPGGVRRAKASNCTKIAP